MQREERIKVSDIAAITKEIFNEPAVAFQDYSDFDSELKEFPTEEILFSAIKTAINSKSNQINFAIYYPEAEGYFFADKRDLNPEKCDGATYRYVASGWGLIHMQIYIESEAQFKVRVAVNTKKRAEAWASTYPEFKSPSLWDWVYIEKQTKRIIKVLKARAL